MTFFCLIFIFQSFTFSQEIPNTFFSYKKEIFDYNIGKNWHKNTTLGAPRFDNYRKKIGNRIYGCDDCLAVCPWNKYAQKTNNSDFFPRSEFHKPNLKSFLKLDDLKFRELFSATSIKRIGRNRFLRNVLIAVGNSKQKNFIKDIIALLRDDSNLVRAMAVWALSQICSKKEFREIRENYHHLETDETVMREWKVY